MTLESVYAMSTGVSLPLPGVACTITGLPVRPSATKTHKIHLTLIRIGFMILTIFKLFLQAFLEGIFQNSMLA